jgi:hypothetical protein
MAWNYKTQRNKELTYWRQPASKPTIAYKQQKTLEKLDYLMNVFPTTTIWRDLYKSVELNQSLSVKQLAAISNAFHKLRK